MTEQKLHYEHIGGKSLEVMSVCPHCKNTKVPISARCKRSKSSIAQAIRDAAVNLTDDDFKNLSVVEFGIIDAFWDGDMSPFPHWSSQCYLQKSSGRQHHARTFMLLVAEALES